MNANNEEVKYTKEQIEECRKKVKELCYTYPDNFSKMLKTIHHELYEFVLLYTSKMREKEYLLSTLCYWVIEGITNWDDLRVRCPTCGKPLKNKEARVRRGYIRPHCSRSCSQADPKVFNKLNEKKLKKYGSKNNSKSAAKTRVILRYYKLLEDQNMTLDASLDEYLKFYNDKTHVYKIICNKCGKVIYSRITNFKHNGITYLCRCKHCFPTIHNRSKAEKELFDFCYDICVKNNLKILSNYRKLISYNGKALEYDIVIPEIKFAIEFDGCYYHSEEFYSSEHNNRSKSKMKFRKLIKTKLIENIGYQCLHINEDDWNVNKQNILYYVKSKIEQTFNFVLYNEIEIVNREIHNKNDVPAGYKLIKELDPIIEIRSNLHIINCGYLVYQKLH